MSEPTDFRILQLDITGTFGTVDVSQIFEELSLFDNMFAPCMSGNIVIRDSINLISKLDLDGNEKIKIKIDKGENTGIALMFEKEFRIHKIINRTNVKGTAQLYTIHFVAKEFIISEKVKVQNYYKGTYTDIYLKIMKEYFGLSKGVPEIALVEQSEKIFEIAIPNLTPLEAVDWIARRAVWKNNKPDFLTYQTQFGYNFVPLSYLLDFDPSWMLNLNVKDVQKTDEGEFLGARDMKIVSQFTVHDSINSGVYGGTFIGFDTMTRTYKENKLSFDDLYGPYDAYHANPYPNIPITKKIPEGDIPNVEHFKKSRISTYPFAIPRTSEVYIKDNNPVLAALADNTHEYIFQRQHIFGNLQQKRLQLTMPGNFALFSGVMVHLDVPKYSNEEESSDDGMDIELTGNYIIAAVRHIIKYDRHETLIEIASDSSIKPR